MGKTATPVGVAGGSGCRPQESADSRYRRAEEAAVPVSQYSMTSVSIWSRSTASSGASTESVQSLNFSTIQASWPTAESCSAKARVCGRVDCTAAYPNSSRW
ncbi:MAG: hypothetical protein HOZ81_20640 [Streptomyces sp.]|nr:hypothetical protein [Streptomyces sp.]NUT24945.1 hypothetical protein [Streptomyces sp.]